MMSQRFHRASGLLALGLIVLPSISATQSVRQKEIPRTEEKRLVVDIEVSFGEVIIAKGRSSKIVHAEFEGASYEEEIAYDVHDGTGRLSVRSKDRSQLWRGKDDEGKHADRKWVLKFTDAVPISLRVELGAGTGEIDLSGLQIERMKISSGASTVSLSCDEPNPIRAEIVDIESGVSKFAATNLVNMNFRKLKFSGGVGAYKLDFGGVLRHDADAKIEVGLGAVTINLPETTPVRLLYDGSWFSSFDLDNGFTKKRSGVYEAKGYGFSGPTLSIQIESGLGSVKVRRKER